MKVAEVEGGAGRDRGGGQTEGTEESGGGGATVVANISAQEEGNTQPPPSNDRCDDDGSHVVSGDNSYDDGTINRVCSAQYDESSGQSPPQIQSSSPSGFSVICRYCVLSLCLFFHHVPSFLLSHHSNFDCLNVTSCSCASGVFPVYLVHLSWSTASNSRHSMVAITGCCCGLCRSSSIFFSIYIFFCIIFIFYPCF